MQMLRDCDIWIHIQYIDPTKVLDHGLPEDLVRPSWLRWSHQPQQVAKTQKTWDTQTAERVRKAFFGGEWWFRVISLHMGFRVSSARKAREALQPDASYWDDHSNLAAGCEGVFLTVGSQSPKVGRSLSSEVWGWYGLICIFCLSWEFFEVLKFWTFKINILELNGGRMEPT